MSECVNNGNARFFFLLFSPQFYLLIDAYTYRYHFIHFLSFWGFHVCTNCRSLPFCLELGSRMASHFFLFGNLSVVVWRNFVLLLVSFAIQKTANRLFKLCQNDLAVNTNVDGNNNHLGEFHFSDSLDYYCVWGFCLGFILFPAFFLQPLI